MGSAEDGTATTPPKPPKSTAPTTTTVTPATVQEPAVSLPTTPPYSADWASAVHAYYSGAAPPPQAFFSPPPVWGSQHMMTPYGTPIPYSPMYHHHPVYAHPSAMPSAAYQAVEVGSSKAKGGGGSGKAVGDSGGKVTSGSADEYGSQSGGESASEGTSGTRDDSAEPQDISRKRSFGDTHAEGENPKPNTGTQNNGTTAESSYSGRARTVSKLPVSAPGRTALPGPPTNLNIGMEIWNPSHVGTATATARQNPVASAAVVANGTMPDHQWKDERELKRERRKQSNRESARRSRLRKQQECEDLARKVTDLNGENSALKSELEQLNKLCKDLEKENASIMEELSRIATTGTTAAGEGGVNFNSTNKASSVSGEGRN